jgi:O-antigen/teichoic acid export membrane protein
VTTFKEARKIPAAGRPMPVSRAGLANGCRAWAVPYDRRMFKRTPAEPGSLAPGTVEGLNEVGGITDSTGAQTREFGGDQTLRQRAARGTLVNSAFLIGFSGLTLLRGFVAAALVSTTDFGLWGILVVALGTLLSLKQVGINDKYIEQDEADQEVAFQKAFTLDLFISLIAAAAIGLMLPAVMLAYGTTNLIAPGFVILAAFLAIPFQAPLWVFYRRMDFVRQRLVQAVDPIVALVVTVVLAALDLGYWAFVIGFAAGLISAAVVAVIFSPYSLKLRFDRGTTRKYFTFSWPLFVATGCALVTAQSAILTSRWELGLAATGALALAAQITIFTDRVDQVITGTLYPAICAVKDRLDVLYESFVKSNRIALMWAVPFGLALTLFSSDLVAFVIGERWRPAVSILEVFGVVAALGHVGFNWTAYFRAKADTKPIATAHVASMVTFLAVGIPGMLVLGLPGFALGIAAQTAVSLVIRTIYLRRLFPQFRFYRQAVRAFVPVLPAIAAVLGARAVAPAPRTLGWALLELALYLAITLGATLRWERALVREIWGYLTRQRPATPEVTLGGATAALPTKS